MLKKSEKIKKNIVEKLYSLAYHHSVKIIDPVFQIVYMSQRLRTQR